MRLHKLKLKYKIIVSLLFANIVLVSITTSNNLTFAFKDYIPSETFPFFGAPIHEDITRAALDFLKPKILADINNEHAFVDGPLQFTSGYHVDGCHFSDSVSKINNHYSRAINDLDPSKRNHGDARDAFGQLLHIVQDFYSHSNWIELGHTDPNKDLIDGGLGLWTPLNGYQVYPKDFMVIQGEKIPPGITLYPQLHNNKIIHAVMFHKIYQGLITGTIPYEPDDCPDNIAIPHWDTFHGDKKRGEQGFGIGLNKDSPSRDNFNEAKNMAIAQTKHEWCRLVTMTAESYGQPGVDLLLKEWVKDRNKAIAACSNLFPN